MKKTLFIPTVFLSLLLSASDNKENKNQAIVVLGDSESNRNLNEKLYQDLNLCTHNNKDVSGRATYFINPREEYRGKKPSHDMDGFLKGILPITENNKVVVHGISLGAVTAINSLAKNGIRNQSGKSKIAGLVALSPFASSSDVFQNTPCRKFFSTCFFCWCDEDCNLPNYNGDQPIDCIGSPDLPAKMLFFASQHDNVVPYTSVARLVKKAAETKEREIFFVSTYYSHCNYIYEQECCTLINDFNNYAFGGACSKNLQKYAYNSKNPAQSSSKDKVLKE